MAAMCMPRCSPDASLPRDSRTSERGESVVTPPMRTFISGLVLTLGTRGLPRPCPRAGRRPSAPLRAGPDGLPVPELSACLHHDRGQRRRPERRPRGLAGWSRAADARLPFLDANPNIGDRYAAAPRVFSTKDPAHPSSWSAPCSCFESEPPVLTEHKGGSGLWLDVWTNRGRSDRRVARLEPVMVAVAVGEEDRCRSLHAWSASESCTRLPWQPALLTGMNSTC